VNRLDPDPDPGASPPGERERIQEEDGEEGGPNDQRPHGGMVRPEPGLAASGGQGGKASALREPPSCQNLTPSISWGTKMGDSMSPSKRGGRLVRKIPKPSPGAGWR
jgi:hypothetical protein